MFLAFLSNQGTKNFAFFVRSRAVCKNGCAFGFDRTLDMVRLAVQHADERLLHRNGTLEHGFHRAVIAAVLDPAYI